MASTLPPVTHQRIQIAGQLGVVNSAQLADLSRQIDVPFHLCCALLLGESSGGKNIYGHDQGGVFSTSALGRPLDGVVTARNFLEFFSQVVLSGKVSNGVGPCQITYAGVGRPRDGGFFRQMFDRGLQPWVWEDNVRFGLGTILAGHLRFTKGDIAQAGTLFNAGTLAHGVTDYGRNLRKRDDAVKKAMGI